MIPYLEERVLYLGDPVVGEVKVLQRPHVPKGDEGDLAHQVVSQIEVGQHGDLKEYHKRLQFEINVVIDQVTPC